MRKATIISIGDELILGQTVDTNSAWLASRLAEFGVRATRHVTVADDREAIGAALKAVVGDSGLVILSGGLGPTADDVTRFALADGAGVELRVHAPSVERLRAFFAARSRDLPEANLIQAQIPETGTALVNTCGTAPGIYMRIDGTPVFALPGVPHELREMFAREVAPVLTETAVGNVIRSTCVQTFGLPEAEIGRRLSDLMERERIPQVGTTAAFGLIGVRINARSASAEAAHEMLDATRTEIEQRLGRYAFGRDDDTLASVVGRALRAVGQTLATAESCTGGLIGAQLTEVPGSSDYYVGSVVCYANHVKEKMLGVPAELLAAHGAVSEQVAEAMVAGCAARFQTDYSLAVTGIAGPTSDNSEKPVGLVFIGLSDGSATDVRKHLFGADQPRHAIRLRAAYSALNLLRLRLLDA